MRWLRAAAIILLLSPMVAAPAIAGARKAARAPAATISVPPLDRVAFAVDGAESSHGADEAMWRADPVGPQGPMQVSAAAASDVGGGDRFDTEQNRAIGRAYLAQLYRRYGDWPDAIAAYNWGIGNFDAWVKTGRPAGGLDFGVVAYLGRVLHDSGLCDGAAPKPLPRSPGKSSAAPDCDELAAWGAAGGGRYMPGGVATHFHAQLDKAMLLAAQHGRGR